MMPRLRTGNFTRAQATGADIHTSDLTFNQSAYALDVRLPGPFGLQMGVADIKSTAFPFAADFAQIGHQLHLLQY